MDVEFSHMARINFCERVDVKVLSCASYRPDFVGLSLRWLRLMPCALVISTRTECGDYVGRGSAVLMGARCALNLSTAWMDFGAFCFGYAALPRALRSGRFIF